MPTFAVDWDGTLVENVYPEKGDWLPGAVRALHALDRLGTVIIHSVRVAPVMPAPGQAYGEIVEFVDFDPSDEVAYIQKMLDDEGLSHLEIWQRPYKPPAAVYIDDKGVYFKGDWAATIEEVIDRIHPTPIESIPLRGVMLQQVLGTAADE